MPTIFAAIFFVIRLRIVCAFHAFYAVESVDERVSFFRAFAGGFVAAFFQAVRRRLICRSRARRVAIGTKAVPAMAQHTLDMDAVPAEGTWSMTTAIHEVTFADETESLMRKNGDGVVAKRLVTARIPGAVCESAPALGDHFAKGVERR